MSANIAHFLSNFAQTQPDSIAIVEALAKKTPDEKRRYKTITFADLDKDTDRIADALIQSGVRPQMRIALMVRQGIDFISLVFGLLKSGATMVLIDPGMGLKQMLQCLSEVQLDGFAAISQVQAARCFLQRRFPQARYNLTVGRRWFWGGLSLARIRQNTYPGSVIIDRDPEDPSAIIFTSGSTGVAKGVLFTHGIFRTQVEEIQKRFEIKPGEIDLSCFPFFGLFNAAMGVTAVIPEMDSTRPANVDPRNILEAERDWKFNQSFASPALWNRVIKHCESSGERFRTLTRAVSAGAPISANMLERFKHVLPEQAEIYTPYGATEALPVAVMGSSEILGETAAKTAQGEGTCVGPPFGTIRWKVIAISDEPIETLEKACECSPGEIGELAVTGPQVTTRYVTRIEANAYAKMLDSQGNTWHRMGDVGYLDERNRFWFCGRKAHRVETEDGPLFSIPCEAIFNQHPQVYRSALVGIAYPTRFADEAGMEAGEVAFSKSVQIPLMYVEPYPDQFPHTKEEREKLLGELRELALENPKTKPITQFLISPAFPVDVRHNAKINREKLAEEAMRELGLR